MTNKTIHTLVNYCIATIWIVNGLFCKVLNFVPRHEQIVAQILQSTHSRVLTIFIGISELFMAIWILSGIKPRLNAITQIVIIAAMNTLEFILVPGLLLWGRVNAIFAFILILVIFFNEFYVNKKSVQRT
jgi:hypothetical protein